MGDGGGGIGRPDASHEVDGVPLASLRSDESIGICGRRGDGSPRSSSGGDQGCGNVGRTGRSGARRGQEGDEAWDEEEDQEEDAADSEEVTALPTSLLTPARSRLLPGTGVGTSPAGGCFWLLAGEDSDEETGLPLDLQGKKCILSVK